MTIAAVVLAAGGSRRLGRPKQEIVLGGETLLGRTTRLAVEAGLARIIVVARDERCDASLLRAQGVVLEVNAAPDEGIASSIRCGITAASRFGVEGAVILTCDQPGLRSEHLRALVEDSRRLTASAYGGSAGVPAYFPADYFSALLELRGDVGARSLLKDAWVIEAEELSLDIDTEQDLARARELFRG